MYSHEIENLLKLRNYLVSREEYTKISDVKSNPQINHIKYNHYDDSFRIDTKDNYHFKLKIKK